MERIKPPKAREEIKQPLNTEQVETLLAAARRSNNPKRNEAILMMLFDSGVRASELVQVKVQDVDIKRGTFEVIGKGNKKRLCFAGTATNRALMVYLRKSKLQPGEPLFPTIKDGKPQHMTRSGLLHLIKRLGKAAGVAVNVHQMRRTFATNILEDGTDIVAVRDMLGHTNIQMTLKYLSVSQAHIESQHRRHSPGDRLLLRKK